MEAKGDCQQFIDRVDDTIEQSFQKSLILQPLKALNRLKRHLSPQSYPEQLNEDTFNGPVFDKTCLDIFNKIISHGYYGEIHINSEVFLWELVQDKKLDRILKGCGATAESMRSAIRNYTDNPWLRTYMVSTIIDSGESTFDGVGRMDRSTGADDKSQYITNLSRSISRNEVAQVIGRDLEIQTVMTMILSPEKKSLLIVGPQGTGKSSIIRGVAHHFYGKNKTHRISLQASISSDRFSTRSLLYTRKGSPDPPKRTSFTLLNMRHQSHPSSSEPMIPQIYHLHLRKMLSRIWTTDTFIKKLKALAQHAMARNAVLWIEDFNLVLSRTSTTKLAAMREYLKPLMILGKLRCIGTLTLSEYTELIADDPFLIHTFVTVPVPEMLSDDAEKVLYVARDQLEAKYGILIKDEALRAAIDLSEHYAKKTALPGRAWLLLENTCARLHDQLCLGFLRLQWLESRMLYLAVGNDPSSPLKSIDPVQHKELLDEFCLYQRWEIINKPLIGKIKEVSQLMEKDRSSKSIAETSSGTSASGTTIPSETTTPTAVRFFNRIENDWVDMSTKDMGSSCSASTASQLPIIWVDSTSTESNRYSMGSYQSTSVSEWTQRTAERLEFFKSSPSFSILSESLTQQISKSVKFTHSAAMGQSPHFPTTHAPILPNTSRYTSDFRKSTVASSPYEILNPIDTVATDGCDMKKVDSKAIEQLIYQKEGPTLINDEYPDYKAHTKIIEHMPEPEQPPLPPAFHDYNRCY
ncbi:hypothetical protein H4219_000308 [Mycoemilia scoparia]|uniref:ClpA/ClpB AAA lid domain-containing protein n=1 Tax=Mycoemilia scoparia TaxID=417184 RepID=A0A9W8A9H4_9FUNG|nr:hypothetical protein H4219_000308 [Mycoemilia scoparia]